MTLFTIVKDLIGKEDVNWGDSSSTFSRETHSGGSTSLHYIDAECIPSTTLGNYIGDHLHEQNTDTSTTSTYFTINSGGHHAKLDTTGLTADRTFTFPNTGDQELIGDTDLGSTSNGLGASLVGVEDSAGLLSATDVEDALAEIAAEVAAFAYPRGYLKGLEIDDSSDTQITLSAGCAHLGSEATYKMVYSTATITFTLGSAGSNAASEDLDAGVQEIHYIYIDESSISSSTLAASNFRNHTDVPTYSASHCGWYSGDDRCIGAVLIDSSNHVVDCYQISNNFMGFETAITEYGQAAAPDNMASLDLSSCVPTFATMAKVVVYNAAGAHDLFIFDINSTGASNFVYYIDTAEFGTFDIPLNSDQTVYWAALKGGSTGVSVTGYYLDRL